MTKRQAPLHTLAPKTPKPRLAAADTPPSPAAAATPSGAVFESAAPINSPTTTPPLKKGDIAKLVERFRGIRVGGEAMIPENVAKASADDLVIRLNGNLEQHKLKKDTEVVSFAARAQSHRARARMRCEIGDVRSRISAYERARARTQVRARMWRSWLAAVGPDAAPARDDGPCVAGGVGRRQHRRPRTFCARRNAYLRVSPVSPRSPAHRTHGGRARWPSPRRSGLALVSVRYTTSPPSHVRPLSSRHAAARRSPTPLTRTLSSSRRDRLT